MNLFSRQDIVLHSGEKSDFKIECDALTDQDISALAHLIHKRHQFSEVFGCPSVGQRLEKALYPYCSIDEKLPFLIVDDVLTTGGSMEKKRQEVVDEWEIPVGGIIGVVIFCRGETCPDWIYPMFRMW